MIALEVWRGSAEGAPKKAAHHGALLSHRAGPHLTESHGDSGFGVCFMRTAGLFHGRVSPKRQDWMHQMTYPVQVSGAK